MNSLANNPQLEALGTKLEGSQPDTAAPATAAPAAPVTEAPRNLAKDRNIAYRILCGMLLVILAYSVHSLIWNWNWKQPFALSDKLDHQGPWYRQAALAPVDWVRSRQYFVESDFWGNKRVRYVVGERQFLQIASGEAAVEVYPIKSTK